MSTSMFMCIFKNNSYLPQNTCVRSKDTHVRGHTEDSLNDHLQRHIYTSLCSKDIRVHRHTGDILNVHSWLNLYMLGRPRTSVFVRIHKTV